MILLMGRVHRGKQSVLWMATDREGSRQVLSPITEFENRFCLRYSGQNSLGEARSFAILIAEAVISS